MNLLQDPRTIEAFGFTIERHYDHLEDPVELDCAEVTFSLYKDGSVGVTMWSGAYPFANDHDMGIVSRLWEACSYATWLLKREAHQHDVVERLLAEAEHRGGCNCRFSSDPKVAARDVNANWCPVHG